MTVNDLVAELKVENDEILDDLPVVVHRVDGTFLGLVTSAESDGARVVLTVSTPKELGITD